MRDTSKTVDEGGKMTDHAIVTDATKILETGAGEKVSGIVGERGGCC